MDKQDFTITQEFLFETFDYKNGVLYWKKPAKFSPIKIGDKAGRIVTDGHLQTCVYGKRLYNHRIIYMMVYGFMPNEIDHIDCNPLNNNIENLRPATRSENIRNRRLHKNNKSGIKGVSWSKKNKKWLAQCVNDHKNHNLGLFNTIEEATIVVKLARNQLHGSFARHE